MGQKIEAEGNELVIRSNKGHIAIIPKDKAKQVKLMVELEDFDGVNDLINTLPLNSEYAADGTLQIGDYATDDPPMVQPSDATSTLGISKQINLKQESVEFMDQKEKDYQEALFDETGEFDLKFREKYKESPHKYKYTTDSNYKANVDRDSEISSEKYGTVDYPSSNKLSKSYKGNPNLAFMNPNKLDGEALAGMEDFHLTVIGAALPIPGVEAMGSIPGFFGNSSKVSKFVPKSVGLNKGVKIDNIAISGNKNIIKKDLTNPNSWEQVWQAEDLPGLHFKSTMEGGDVSKIVDKTGKVNVEQALGIIGKESGGAEKIVLVKESLGDNIPSKMDYNEFRKVIQDKLVPLNRDLAAHASNYGIGRLGYLPAKRASYDKSIEWTKKLIANGEDVEENTIKLNQLLKEYETLPLENETLILSNKSEFGLGSAAHNNPEETLGHIHFLRDKETPEVLTITQLQSDAFQGTHRIMPTKGFDLEKEKRHVEWLKEGVEKNRKMLAHMKETGTDVLGSPVPSHHIKRVEEDIVLKGEAEYEFRSSQLKNFTQKQLLEKSHQERYLQEFVDYAGKRGDVGKVRIPTSETAAKVQGYSPTTTSDDMLEYYNEYKGTQRMEDDLAVASSYHKDMLEKILSGKIKGNIYSSEHSTILKKYSEQPKTIKKLFGEEPKIVTDNKGNTWYEFDIPKKFKEGKGEIKAFSTIPAIGAIGASSVVGSPDNSE